MNGMREQARRALAWTVGAVLTVPAFAVPGSSAPAAPVVPAAVVPAAVVVPLVAAPVVAAGPARAVPARAVPAAPARAPGRTPARLVSYPLVVTQATTADSPVHGPYAMTADMCAVCHRSHTAASANLISQRGGQSTLCFTCHDGTGAVDVKSRFTTADIPADDPSTRSYYGHDLSNASAHTLGNSDEFGGVSNRHTECGDCHNPHRPGGDRGSSTVEGWTAPGTLSGVSGVSVVNGEAGTAPVYTFLDGATNPISLEYQLCFKCHSGFTKLPSNEGLPPSQHLLDKGVEFNPNNPSYHPVESVGRNQTPAMAASLAGASPYKLWSFTPTSTIRCANCHADDTVIPSGGQVASGDLAPAHRSANRGILLANYRDRVLKPAGEKYAAADFALCYLCHAESPFVSDSSTATNFALHAKHVSGIGEAGSAVTDIDTPGAGQGNALCAECHYRLHSVSYKVGSQTVPGSRLVNFAPDVTANGGVLSWTPGATAGGSCTLTCHGHQHTDAAY